MDNINCTTAVIDGVEITPLSIIDDPRGSILHMLRADTQNSLALGEIYFSWIKVGAIKAWKCHREMTQNIAVPVGEIRLVMYDDRPSSVSFGDVCNIHTGAGCTSYQIIRIPAMIWYGFEGLGITDSLIANCASMPHNPDEVIRLPQDTNSIPYKWR